MAVSGTLSTVFQIVSGASFGWACWGHRRTSLAPISETMWISRCEKNLNRCPYGFQTRSSPNAMMGSAIKYVLFYPCIANYASCTVKHKVLWPLLHYTIPDAPRTKSFYETDSWSHYIAVNQKFADAIVENYEEGDIREWLYIR